MAFTAPKTWTVGETVSASELNTYVRDNLSELYTPPGVRLRLTANQSISNNSSQVVAWNEGTATAEWNVGPCWSTATPSRIKPSEAGVWRFEALGTFAVNSSGQRRAAFRLNGSTATQFTLQQVDTPPTTGAGFGAAVGGVEEYTLTTTEFVEFVLFQNSGAALNALGNASAFSARTYFDARLVSTATATASG